MVGQASRAATGHRDWVRPGAASRVCQVAVRHRLRSQVRVELRPERGGNAMSHRLHPRTSFPGPRTACPRTASGQLSLSTGPGAPTTVLAGVMTPTIPLFDSVWFQALVVFVAINTLFYAGLAVAKLVPRRRLVSCANAPSTPAAAPIALGDGGRCGGQNSSSSSMNSVGSKGSSSASSKASSSNPSHPKPPKPRPT